MAGGTPLYVRVTGNPSSDVLALAAAVNTIINDLYTHTHKTPTTNPGISSIAISSTPDTGSTGGTAIAAPASQLYDVNTAAAIAYTTG